MTSLSPLLKQATPVVVDHASGCWIHGQDGVDYLDFTTGIGVTSTGHCHPRVVEAAREQAGSIIHAQYTTVMHQPLLDLTERLGEVLPEGLDSVFYANSGSEAVESAVRLARMATGRPNIVVFQGGFHGRTVAAATLTTAGTRFAAGFSPLMGGVHMAPFPYAYRYGWDLDTTIDFCLQELDYLFATRTARSRMRLDAQGGTYGGNAVAAAAGCATLDVIRDEHLVDNARERGEQLRAGLDAIAADHPAIGNVRGLGLMQGIELTTPDGRPDTATAVAIQQATTRHGLLTLTCGPLGNVVRVMPALVVSAEEIDLGLERFRATVEEITNGPTTDR